jgi:CheY-like chemotaxis protein
MTMSDERLMLYVEDNPDHAELVMRSLERHRIQARVVHVEDGQAALDYLAGSGQPGWVRPWLILLDLRLPKVDGIAVLSAVREAPPLANIPVVVLTTSGNDSDVQRAYQHHVNSYVVKPDDLPTLDGLMNSLGSYWISQNVQPAFG